VPRSPLIVLSAATTVAALSVCGCSTRDLAARTPGPLSSSLTSSTHATSAPPADPGPLPEAAALTDVMARLADPAVPGTDKLALVANTGPTDAPALDRFAGALRDTGFAPVTVTATEIRWSDSHPGDVVALVKLSGGQSGPNGPAEFAFPMEFTRTGTGWQLTRETAEELLAFGNARTDTPGPPPAASPAPSPGPATPPP
jgi:hypothetical protein